MTNRVLLIGMMGAGKSTCGSLLAARMGWPFLDSDWEIQRTTGLTVPEIFTQKGEAAFRAEEARVLAEATTSAGPVVVSVAGGAVMDPENRRRIRQAGLVVWLKAELTTLSMRVGSGIGRPLLGDDPASALARLYPERLPVYGELADVVLHVDEQAPTAVVDRIMSELSARGVTSRA